MCSAGACGCADGNSRLRLYFRRLRRRHAACSPCGEWFSRPERRPGPDAVPARGVLRIGSVKPLLCAPAPLPPAAARAALVSYIKQGDQSEPFPGMYMYNLQDGCGFLVLAENASGSNAMSVQLDHSECVNLIPSRGSLTTYDTLPPKHVQILQVLSRAAEADCVMLVSANFRSEPWMGGESLHSPGVVEGGVHDPQRQAPGGARGSGGKLLGALSRLRF